MMTLWWYRGRSIGGSPTPRELTVTRPRGSLLDLGT
jgi:hypothetical protein